LARPAAERAGGSIAERAAHERQAHALARGELQGVLGQEVETEVDEREEQEQEEGEHHRELDDGHAPAATKRT
jgi:hypothetical protein